ncbi:MAG: hypothetical protein MRY74_00055 [Neomegalonema sp.]|nr:hypothetical protein [Neomegalonema sp.]
MSEKTTQNEPVLAESHPIKDINVDELRRCDAGGLAPWRDLFAQQAALELDLDVLSRDMACKRVEGAIERRAESELRYGRQVVEGAVTPLAAAIEAYLAEVDAAGKGRKPEAAVKLRETPAVKAALLTLRVLADGLSVETPLSRAACELGALIEEEARFEAMRALDRQATDRLLRALSRKSRRRARKAMLARAADALKAPWTPWTKREMELVGVKLIDLALELVPEFEAKSVRVGDERTEWRIVATARKREEVAKLVALGASVRPIRAPMIAAPRPFENASNGGYLTSGVRPLSLVKPQQGRRAEPEDAPRPEAAPIVFLAANAAQETPWRVNKAVLAQMRRALDGGAGAAVLPAAEPAPEPTDDGAGGAAHWRRRAEWGLAEQARRARRISVERTFSEAQTYMHFEKLFFPVQYDFRGRMYAAPTFSPQGPDAMRGLLQFARGKPLGEEGCEWLAIHLCNVGDFEKMSKAPLEERAAWVLRNEERILTVATDPEADLFWTEADQPWQFLAACFEWAGFRKEGARFVSHLPVALDGACSGLQHFSLALRDEVGGAAVNLSPREGRAADIYEEVAERVRSALEAEAQRGDAADADEEARRNAELARQWLSFGVDRKLCKRPTMTYGYGARGFGYAEQVLSDVLAPAYEAHCAGGGAWPFEARGFKAATFIATRLMSAIEATVTKAAEAMRWLQHCASLAADAGEPLVWRAPDGFIVRQDYRETRARRIRAVLAGKPIRLTLQEPEDELDKRRQRQGVAPNFVHALDSCHMRLTVARAWEEGLRDFALIHDSFGVHAADTPRFFQLIRETMVEMYEQYDVMADFAAQLAQRLDARDGVEPPPRSGALRLEGVLESEFCFS